MPALILDCDGVLAETERELHLPAFNQAFEERGLPLRWTEAEYGERLRVAGGKERIATSLTAELMASAGLSSEPGAVLGLAERLHQRKTELLAERFDRHPPSGRPGVRRIVEAALAAGWKVAVASTSAEASVRRIVDAVLGASAAGEVLVLAGDVVAAKKPDPAIYELAVDRLGVTRTEAIAIEDSRNGLLAAVGAGLACVVTVSEYSAGEDFGEAPLVVSSLGDPGEELTVVANRSALTPRGQLTLDDLAELKSWRG